LRIQRNIGSASFEEVLQDEIDGTLYQKAQQQAVKKFAISGLVAERQPQHQGQIQWPIGSSGYDLGNANHLILSLATCHPHEDRDITTVN
jgi:hypothetical protein